MSNLLARLNYSAKAALSAVFVALAVALESSTIVDDVSAWVTGTLTAVVAAVVVWLKANGPNPE